MRLTGDKNSDFESLSNLNVTQLERVLRNYNDYKLSLIFEFLNRRRFKIFVLLLIIIIKNMSEQDKVILGT